jgi:beta-galactosidase
MKIDKLLFFLVVFLYSGFSFGRAGFGKAEKINDNWKFVLQDIPTAKEENFNDTKWQKVDLPHDWSIRQPFSPTYASCMGYLPGGIGWYRKNIHIPGEKAGEKVYLYFEGIYNRSEVYINGHLLGRRPNGYISFLYDASPYIKYGEDNMIAVRVDHSRAADSRWYTGSGIYRNVWLVFANPVHIAQWGVYAHPSEASAKKRCVGSGS